MLYTKLNIQEWRTGTDDRPHSHDFEPIWRLYQNANKPNSVRLCTYDVLCKKRPVSFGSHASLFTYNQQIPKNNDTQSTWRLIHIKIFCAIFKTEQKMKRRNCDRNAFLTRMFSLGYIKK